MKLLFFLEGTSCPASEHPNNLALGKTAYQSSTYESKGSASHGVDGKLDTNYNTSNGCIHTNNDNPPWWLVDLGDNYVVSTVIVVNRDMYGKLCLLHPL